MSMTTTDSRALAVFDVCDTLYAVNTTIAFLQLMARKRTAIAKALTRWTSRSSPFYYAGALSHRLLKRDLARTRLIAALRGIAQSEIEAAGRELATEKLPGLANTELHNRLQWHCERGDDILLMSNSLDAVVRPIAESLGVSFRASELEYRSGVCTGRLHCDLTGRKAAALREATRATASKLWVYTDNRSDADIIALADERIIVLPRGSKGHEWGRNVSEYIRL